MVNENYVRRKSRARAKATEVIKLDTDGLQRTEIARRIGISMASVYWALAEAKRVAGDLVTRHDNVTKSK
jgi:transposase